MMATGSSQPRKNNAGAKASLNAPMALGQKVKIGVIAVLSLIVLWLVFNFADIKAQAKLGVSYASHTACSCRYVQGRPLDACYKDFEPGMGMVSLADDPENKRVTASVPLLAAAVAEKRGDFGCHQLNDKEVAKLD
jgi:hypothetical protein